MKTILSFFALLLFIGCSADLSEDYTSLQENASFNENQTTNNNHEEDYRTDQQQNEKPPAPLSVKNKETNSIVAPRHIIKNANLRIQVKI